MVSDSQFTRTILPPGETIPLTNQVFIRSFNFTQSESVYKTYLLGDRVGISLFGSAEVGGHPISGYMESFVKNHAKDTGTIHHFADSICSEFRDKLKHNFTGFHIAGYDSIGGHDTPVVYRLPVQSGPPQKVNSTEEPYGAVWDGDTYVVDRLFKRVSPVQDQGNCFDLEDNKLAFKWFTLQDAIDFAVYCIQTTAGLMRFQDRRKTVGGPIDVLIIRPSGAEWLERKVIRMRR
jgi:hypothetical protein